MNKYVLLSALALPSLVMAQEEYTVKGKIGNIQAPAKIFMQYSKGGERAIDSANVVNGEFKFLGLVDEPSQAYLILSPDGKTLRELKSPEVNVVYLSKGVIEVNGADLQSAEVSGTVLNTEFKKYKLATKPVEDQMKALDSEYAAASAEKKEDPAFIQGLQERATKIYASQETINKEYIVANPKSYVSMNLIDELVNADNVKEMADAFSKLPAEYKASKKGKGLQEKMDALNKLAVGALAPDITMPNVNDQPTSLSSLRGQYVLVDFWASWCGPCRQENPHVVAAYNKFKDKGFTIYGVSLDRPGKKEDWVNAIEKDGLGQWTNVSDLQFWKSPVVKTYALQGIPQNYLLDKEGRIVASNLRGQALEDKLAEILK